jgi:DAK2 domain fusion protein YloV
VGLSACDLKRVFEVYQRMLDTHRRALNDLNVYPVPDGDTGSNMAQTVDSIVRHLDGASTMTEVVDAVSRGSLIGAAGNSGVILSQVLRGMGERFAETEEIGPLDLALGLGAASAAAYRAVARPVEGTILTVVRESAEAAAAGETDNGDLGSLLRVVFERARHALEKTPDLLSVLADAGVVDAGGAGYLLLIASMLEVATGTRPDLPEQILTAKPAQTFSKQAEAEEGPRYEVMYFLEAGDQAIDAFRDTWRSLGDSIVVVGGEGLWNCHIHTDDIGAAVEAGIQTGRPRDIRITDLHEQVGVLESDVAAGGFSPLPTVLDAPIGVVAVVNGPGLVERFRRLGVQGVVAGGQSANPTVEQVLEAVEGVSAQTVVILPNNKNVVPVAEQVDALTTKIAAVVPTRSLTQGLAAMLGYVPGSDDLEELMEDMAVAAGAIDFGEVTQAVRDANVEGWHIEAGDWMGVADGRIVVVDRDRFSALRGLVAAIMPRSSELVTVYAGDNASPSDTKALEAWLSETHPGIDVEVLQGGQPLYPYLVSVE